MGRVSRREWAWAGVFAALVMALTALPYLVGWAGQGAPLAGGQAAWRFSGFVLAVEDGNSYLAKMQQGAAGAWLYRLAYSSEPQAGMFVYPFYLLLGRLVGPDHDRLVLAYHAVRLLCGWGLLLVVYRFLAEYLARVSQRRLGLALVALGGGLGWALALFGQLGLLGSLPVDFISPEAFSFLLLLALPHLAAARALFLLAWIAYGRGRPAWAGAALLGVSLIQPLSVVLAWALLGLDVVRRSMQPQTLAPPTRAGVSRTAQRMRAVRAARPPEARPELAVWPLVRELLLIGLLSFPVVVYTLWVMTTDPVYRQWNAQNVLTTPHPLHYLLAYGPWLLLALPGWRVMRRRAGQADFLLLWVAASLVLIYLPLTPQRRLIEAAQVPLAILAVTGLTVGLRRARRWLTPLTCALLFPTSLLLLTGGLAAARSRAEPVFQPRELAAVGEWLAAQSQPGAVVLGAYETGNVLPAYAPVVAYIGHGPETVFVAEKRPRVDRFYQAQTADVERQALLESGRIGWVVLGPRERALGGFEPARAAYLRERFSAGDYHLYEVVR